MTVRSEVFLLAAAALVPSAFGSWFLDPFVLPKLALAATLTAAAAVVLARGPAGTRGLETGLLGPAAALAAAWAASTALAADRWPAFAGQPRHYACGLLGWTILAGAAACAASQEARWRRRLAAAVAAGSLPVSAYALAQRAGFDPLGPGMHAGRALSSLGGPVQLGAYLAAGLPAAVAAARSPCTRTLGVAALLLGTPALAATLSRAAWLAAACGIGVALAFGAGRLRAKALTAAAMAAAVAVGAMLLAPARGKGDRQRVEVWTAAWGMFVERPWFGVGPDGFGTAFRRSRGRRYAAETGGIASQPDAHDDWLQVLSTLGLAGLAAYAWLHAAAWKALRGSLSEDAAGLAGTLAALFVQVKLNTPSWGALFIGALAFGTLLSRDARAGKNAASRARLGRAGTATAAIAAAGAALWLAAADQQAAAGVRLRARGSPRAAAVCLERAVAWSPYDSGYRMRLDNLLWDVAEEADGPGRRLILARAWEVAEEGTRRRPADPGAHQLLGLAELRRTQWGGERRLVEARAAFDRALELDPYFPGILGPARRAAELAGDAEAARRFGLRLKALGFEEDAGSDPQDLVKV